MEENTTTQQGFDFLKNLSLSFDSGAGNGIAGPGWNIPAVSVKQKTDKGLSRYLVNTTDDNDSDIFLLYRAENLVIT